MVYRPDPTINANPAKVMLSGRSSNDGIPTMIGKYKAQFANCVLALCVIDEIVINSMTSGKIMEIRPPVS